MNNQRGGIAYFDKDVIGVEGFTWNPVTGCTFGCPECWARVMATRLSKMPYSFKRTGDCYLDVKKKRACDVVAEAYRTFKSTLHHERLDAPAKRKKPAVIGVCFMGDYFDPALKYGDFALVLNAMLAAPQHTYILLTKRPERVSERLSGLAPQSNWYLGFSARTQAEFDAGMPHMAKLAAAGWKTWVSLEPMQEGIDVSKGLSCLACSRHPDYFVADCATCENNHPLSGVILGGQSGKGAKPLDPNWVRSVRDQCAAAGVKFMYKQGPNETGKLVSMPYLDGVIHSGVAWGNNNVP